MKRAASLLVSLILLLLLPLPGIGESTAGSSGGYEYVLHEDGTAGIVRYTGPDTQLTVPDSLDGHPVTLIGNEAFMNSGLLQGVTMPEGVTAIGMKAFYNCSGLSEVILPGSLRTIGGFAFSYCGSLQTVKVPEGTQSIGEFAFGECAALWQAFLPGSVTAIGPEAFEGASPDFKLWCEPGSYAGKYAQENGIPFEEPAAYVPDTPPESLSQSAPVETGNDKSGEDQPVAAGEESAPVETAQMPADLPEGDRESVELTLQFPSDERSGMYTGETQDGLPHGKGSFSSANSEGTGWTYTGSWEMGVIQGEGETIWENGTGYRGSYERFELTHGRLFKGETVLYDGSFSTGLTGGPVFHGQGKLYNALGRLIFEGEFEKGYLKETDVGRSARAAVLDPQCQSMSNDEYLALLNTQETGLLVKLQGTVGEITVLDSEGHCEFFLLNNGSGTYPLKAEYRYGVDEPKIETGQAVTVWGSVTGTFRQEAGAVPEPAEKDAVSSATGEARDPGDAAMSQTERLMPLAEADVVAKTADAPAGSGDGMSISADKRLDGRPLKNGEFTFLLCRTFTVLERQVLPLSGAVIFVPVTYTQQLQTQTNDRNGHVAFDPIRYTAADIGRTFTYTVTEIPGIEAGMAYDPMVMTVTVVVADRGGALSALVFYPADMEFNNTYRAVTELLLEAGKELQGRALKYGEFTFELIRLQGGEEALMAATMNGRAGEITFGPLQYTQKDAGKSFTYLIREVPGSEAGMAYDPLELRIIVTVRDLGNGMLQAAAQYPADTVFSNIYTPAESPLILSGINASKTSVETGETVYFTPVVSGGKAPYQFTYMLYKDGEAYSDYPWLSNASEPVELKEAGVYQMEGMAMDANGTQSQSVMSPKVTVREPEQAPTLNSIKVSNTSVETGETVTFTPIVSGGKAPFKFTYMLYKDGSANTDYGWISDQALSVNLKNTGVYEMKATVMDSNRKQSASILSPKVTVREAIAPFMLKSVAADKTAMEVGDTVTFTPSVSGGEAPYWFYYLLLRDGESNTEFGWLERASLPVTINGPGVFQMKVVVEDAKGKQTGAVLSPKVTVREYAQQHQTPSPKVSDKQETWTPAALSGSWTITSIVTDYRAPHKDTRNLSPIGTTFHNSFYLQIDANGNGTYKGASGSSFIGPATYNEGVFKATTSNDEGYKNQVEGTLSVKNGNLVLSGTTYQKAPSKYDNCEYWFVWEAVKDSGAPPKF